MSMGNRGRTAHIDIGAHTRQRHLVTLQVPSIYTEVATDVIGFSESIHIVKNLEFYGTYMP